MGWELFPLSWALGSALAWHMGLSGGHMGVLEVTVNMAW